MRMHTHTQITAAFIVSRRVYTCLSLSYLGFGEKCRQTAEEPRPLHPLHPQCFDAVQGSEIRGLKVMQVCVSVRVCERLTGAASLVPCRGRSVCVCVCVGLLSLRAKGPALLHTTHANANR